MIMNTGKDTSVHPATREKSIEEGGMVSHFLHIWFYVFMVLFLRMVMYILPLCPCESTDVHNSDHEHWQRHTRTPCIDGSMYMFVLCLPMCMQVHKIMIMYTREEHWLTSFQKNIYRCIGITILGIYQCICTMYTKI